VTLALIAEELDRPLDVAHAGDCSHRLFIVEKTGAVRVWENGSVLDEPFVDLTDRVKSGGEQGLLNIAFHPEYAENGRAFLVYTDETDDVILARFTVHAGDANRLDPDSEMELARVPQPYENHNGGQLAFGPDGYLYWALGDGGSWGDPEGHAQDTSTLLGAILRLDVDAASGYGIPADNPFVNDEDARDEIWAYGLRNPWRFSFDRETGDLWIADVGQDRVEEVNLQPAGSAGGENYGWPAWEGSERYDSDVNATEDMVFPVHDYEHDADKCSVIGGFVYRGQAFPALAGAYVFTDMCAGDLWALDEDGDAWVQSTLLEAGNRFVAFGEDETGELYAVDHLEGTVYRVEPQGA
jgi:glucose/arabinose dehydrogenase